VLQTCTRAVRLFFVVVEINIPTGEDESAHILVPLAANAQEQKRGLKSADGSVCLYMDENKLTLFDDERGRIVAQVTAER